jgi:uncharacterized protein YdeI (YjbR/CyaY-like superfamily)
MPADPRVDQYIAAAPGFAQPILKYLRDLLYKGCPEIEETIKWSRPIFMYRKKILFGMAAFKAHCSFGFWNPEVGGLLELDGVKSNEGSGSLGKITQIADLPPKEDLLRYIRESKRRVEEPEARIAGRKRTPSALSEIVIPEDLAAALDQNKAAAKAFHRFSPSHRREYIEWIVEAKRAETRRKRVATTLEWPSEGKSRNWKYENPKASL